uniref:Uncharacterized protein n=1 Tax=Oryza barthii TaxID=65489 RepID=A0A679B9S9_9ORYZ|nr:hypothetical protein [Oryza barthii]BBF89258.1 hypothetical protein [Oryza barthii]
MPYGPFGYSTTRTEQRTSKEGKPSRWRLPPSLQWCCFQIFFSDGLALLQVLFSKPAAQFPLSIFLVVVSQ